MKKIISIFLVLCITLSILTSCTSHEHSWIDANCTSPKKCEICGQTEGEALGHNYVDGICSSCNQASPEDDSATKQKYEEAMELINSRNYEEAREILSEIVGYKDSAEHLKHFYWMPTLIYTYDEEDIDQFTVEYDSTKRSITITHTNNYEDFIETQTYTFDENYNVISVEYSDSDNRYTIDTYEYDSKGNLIKYVTDGYVYEYSYNDKGELIKYAHGDEIEEYTYDKNGNILTQYRYNNGTCIETNDYTYDENGTLLQYVTETYLGTSTVTYTYTENGSLTKTTVFAGKMDIAPDFETTETYTVDENGRVIKIEQNGKILHAYTYDENGNVLSHIQAYSNSDAVSTNIYKYDELGRVIWYYYQFSYYPESIFEWVYDENGALTVLYQDEEELHRFNYEYVYIPADLTLEDKDTIITSMKDFMKIYY